MISCEGAAHVDKVLTDFSASYAQRLESQPRVLGSQQIDGRIHVSMNRIDCENVCHNADLQRLAADTDVVAI